MIYYKLVSVLLSLVNIFQVQRFIELLPGYFASDNKSKWSL